MSKLDQLFIVPSQELTTSFSLNNAPQRNPLRWLRGLSSEFGIPDPRWEMEIQVPSIIDNNLLVHTYTLHTGIKIDTSPLHRYHYLVVYEQVLKSQGKCVTKI